MATLEAEALQDGDQAAVAQALKNRDRFVAIKAKEMNRARAAALEESLVRPIRDRASTPPLEDADLTFQGLNSTYQSSECGSEAPSEVRNYNDLEWLWNGDICPNR